MLSGCGGGSSSTRVDTDTGTMTGDNQTLTVPDSMTLSTATPVYATNADTFESSGLETTYPALSSLMERDFGNSTVTLEDGPLDGHANISIADDNDNVTGDEDIVVTVVFDDGEELTVSYTSADYQGDDSWLKEIDGEDYWFWFWSRDYRHFAVVATEFCDPCAWANSTFGARTAPANMPAGTATYIGRARADSYPKDTPSGPLA